MSRVQTLLLGVGQVYRRRRLTQIPKEPLTLRNAKDEQMNILYGDPIFPKTPPVEVATYEELLTVEPPLTPQHPEQRMIIVEDDGIFPLTRQPLPSPDEQQEIRLNVWHQYYAEAEAAEAKKAGATLQTWVVGTAAISAVILLIVIAGISLSEISQPDPEETTGLIQFIRGRFA